MPAIVIPAPNANVKKSDIINNLTSTAANVPLAAAQGKALKDLIAQSTATIAITSGSDLNNYTENGVYSCASASIASTLSHCPVDVGFVMCVYKWGAGSAQVIYVGNRIITRRLISEVWYTFEPLTAFSSTTVSGTTTADGFLPLNMTTWQHLIVELYSRTHICLLYADDGGNYFAKVLNYNMEKVASTSVSVGVRYKTVM